MGRKVHPVGFRLGIIRDWQSRWYAEKQYLEFLQEDIKLRQAIRTKYAEAGISAVEIERQANEVTITVHTARPGVVIGRGGQRVDEMRVYLERLVGKKVRLNIQEIRQAELDAYLVARAIAEQIERRVTFRRAMKQAIFRTMQAGARGIRIICSGRLGGAEIARRQMMHQGRVPLQTLRADIDYGFTEAHTTVGRLGIKVWIYKGEVLPELKEAEAEAAAPVAVEAGAVPTAVTEAEKPAMAEAPAVPTVAKEVAPVVEAVRRLRRVRAEAPAAVAEEKKPARKARKARAEEAPAAVAEAGKRPARKPKAEEPVAVAEEKKPARKAKAEEAPVAAEAEKKPARKTKTEEAPAAEAEKKSTRKVKAEEKSPEATEG